MDPVSAIGLLASICTLARASNEAITLLRSFKEGADETARLINQVSFFEENLKSVERIFRSKNHRTQYRISTETINDAIAESSATLADLQSRLARITKSEIPAVRRVKWVQHRSDLLKIEDRIRDQCAMLHHFVSLAQAELLFSVCGQNSQVFDVSAEIGMDQTGSCELPLESGMPSRIPALRRPGNGTDPDDRELLLPAQWQGSDWTGTDSSTISSKSSTSSRWTRSSFSSSTSSDTRSSTLDLDVREGADSYTLHGPQESTPSGELVIRRSCRFDCFCQCHSQSTSGTKKDMFSKFHTPAYPRGRIQKVECTEPECVGAAACSPQTRVLPSTLLKRAMAHLVSSSQSPKSSYPLNRYRMVPEGAVAMRYVKHGNLDKLKLLMKMGEATPWDTAPDGWSLLHTAVYAGQLPTVKYLCELGVDTEVADFGARKPADLAALKSLAADATKVEKEIVRICSKDNDYITDFEFSPIHIAVLGLYDLTDSERPSLQALIDFVDDANNAAPGTDWVSWKANMRRRSPLYCQILEQFRVSAKGNKNTNKVIHNLLDQKDRKLHWTPLHWASATNRADSMRTLIYHGADPFIQSNLDFNILHAAVESNALSSLKYALDIWSRHPAGIGIDQPNVWGESPLIMAAQGCRVDCVRLLLEAGADPNVRQENGQVALHYAGLSQRDKARLETTALLCSKAEAQTEADPSRNQQDGSLLNSFHINAQDEDGRPPLFDFLDDTACTDVLIRQGGARLDLFDRCGRSVFHHVCIQGETAQLRSLLQFAPNTELLRRKDNEGNTPLIQALRNGSVDCATMLLELSPSDNDMVGDTLGPNGWSAAHYAAKLGDRKLLELVLAHPTFVRGMKTADGKGLQEIAMEEGNWCGRIKELVRRYNNCVGY